MKQITIRLNEQGEKELAKLQARYETTKAAPCMEKALMMHLWYVDKVAELERKIAEQNAIISYLESNNR